MNPTPFNRMRIALTLLVFMLVMGFFSPMSRADRPAGVGADPPVTSAQESQARPAAILEVTNLNDNGLGSLRQTIASSMPGDIINFAPDLTGTITLTSGELIINKNLAISGPGREFLIISGNDASRVFNVQASAVTIRDLTIANGDASNDTNNSSGGGIFINGNLTISNARIINNTASDGGGIAINASGSLFMSNSTILDNVATGDGGGIFYNSIDSTMTIINSTISGNTALNGGGIHTSGTGPFPIAISTSTISNNTVSGNGGGINIEAGAVNLINSTISNNSAPNGGGIFNSSAGTLSIRFSTLTINTGTGGGGIFQVSGGVTNLTNAIVAGNTAPTGPDVSGPANSQGHNIIGNNSGASITAMAGDQIGTAANPIDAKLTPLQNNGGPTKTHSPISGSPAINAGNNMVTPSNDQRGLFRFRGGPIVDIGAVEFKPRLFSSLIITRIAPTADTNKVSVTALLTNTETGQPLSSRNIDFRFSRFFGDLDGDAVMDTTDIDGFATAILGVGMSSGPRFGALAQFSDDPEFEFSQDFLGFSLGQFLLPAPTPQGGGGCQFLIFGTDESFAANGGSGSFNVTTFPQDCNWTAVSNDPWIQITSSSTGVGDGIVTYTVGAHTDPINPRAGSITVGDLTFNVLQGAAFLDVPESNPFYNFIGKLSARRVTLGTGGGNYSPNDVVTRQQMAAFIIRALGEFNPPQPPQQRFLDVPPANPFFAFIEQMAIRQITLGCSANLYCPLDVVNRQQMAAFLIRAVGEPNPPVPFLQRFADVEPSNIFYTFIERMAVRRITLGCDANLYCPIDSVTRGQMAAFLVRAFKL